jgi:protein HOOK3
VRLFTYAEEEVSQKSEDNLSIAEAELDKNAKLVEDLTKTVDELQVQADEAAQLKDKLDECVHFVVSCLSC